MNEIKHEIIVKGTPKIENIPKETLKIFCETILGEIEIYYAQKYAEELSDKIISTL